MRRLCFAAEQHIDGSLSPEQFLSSKSVLYQIYSFLTKWVQVGASKHHDRIKVSSESRNKV